MSYKVLDLFSGAGGFSLGFKDAGFHVIGAVDFDKTALLTHEKNIGGLSLLGDISTISDATFLKHFQGIDVIIGGPPCQGFSTANRSQSDEEKHEKNRLFYEYLRVVKLLKPTFFVIENVRNFLNWSDGIVLKELEEHLSALGYHIQSQVFHLKNYSVPQKRVRAFVLGHLNKDIDLKRLTKNQTFMGCFDYLIHDQDERSYYSYVYDALSDLYTLEYQDVYNGPITSYQAYLNKHTPIIHNHTPSYPRSEQVIKRLPYIPQGGNWKNVPPELFPPHRRNYQFSNSYYRLDECDVSPTVDTGHGNIYHPIFNRQITVREAARLQSFPDDFIFYGSKTEQMRQVGNAVPPLFAKQLATFLKSYL